VLATNILCLVVGSGGAAAAATAIALFNYTPGAAFAGAFLGCFITLELSALGLIPSIASASATALLCGQLLLTRSTKFIHDAFFPALYGGTFAGMTSILWLVGGHPGGSLVAVTGPFLALSVVCGTVFFVVAQLDAQLTTPIGHGYGGRLGATAAVASFLFIDFGHRLLAVQPRISDDIPAAAVTGTPAGPAMELTVCMVGIFITLAALRQRHVAAAGGAPRIFVASTVALLGQAILYVTDSHDSHRLGAFYAGCFLGMSTPERLKGWIQPLCAAVLLTLILNLVRSVLPDIGGGGGLAAFVTVAILVTLTRMMEWTRQTMGRRKRATEWARPAASAKTHERDCAIIRTMRDRSTVPSPLGIHRQPSSRSPRITCTINSAPLAVITDISVTSLSVDDSQGGVALEEVTQS
jgi:hypothetical protein